MAMLLQPWDPHPSLMIVDVTSFVLCQSPRSRGAYSQEPGSWFCLQFCHSAAVDTGRGAVSISATASCLPWHRVSQTINAE